VVLKNRASARLAALPPGGEAAIWRGVGVRWRQLFGDFARIGVSFEWHELAPECDVDWARSFHADSVELCLNLAGAAEVAMAGDAVRFGPWTAGFYRQGKTPLRAHRRGGEAHQFITVELAPEFLNRHLRGCAGDLHPLIRRAAVGEDGDSAVGSLETMNSRQRELVASLRQPPVLASAQAVWYQAKAVELMGEFFFQPVAAGELFCHRQQRVARDRVDQVVALLKRDLAAPPALEEIGRTVGCSPFYLSRTFSKETGQTIPQYVRRLRLDKAAELLRSGDYNVTEAALEVGYSSLSHFSQAFHQQFGCCPGLYPMATPTQRAAAKPGASER
jgi:AraC family transcriptional regulator